MAKSGIHIKPSKRGTFTAAAKSRGKTVQGFASQVMKNPDNYSPAMVKKANFARNAAKWKKELGGYLDQQLNEIPIIDTPIDSSPVPKTQFAYGGKIPQKPSLSTTGLAAGKSPKDYSEEQLRLGIDVEHEHTKNNALAVKIAMDHLEENPQYYSQLPDPDMAAQQGAAMDAMKKKRYGGSLYQNGGMLSEEMMEIREGGLPEVFEEIREGEPEDLKAMRKMGVLPKFPGTCPKDQQKYGCGGKLGKRQDGGNLNFAADAAAMGHTLEEHAAHTFQDGGELPQYQWGGQTFGEGANARNLGTGQLASRHEDLKNLKYLDLPDTDWGSLAMNVGGAALSAYGGAGGTFGGAIGEGASGILSNINPSDVAGLGSAMMGASSGQLAGANVVGGGYGGYDMTAMGGLATGQYMQRQNPNMTLSNYLQQKQQSQQQAQFDPTQTQAHAQIMQMGQNQMAGQRPLPYAEGGQLAREPQRLADPEKTELNISTQEDYDMIFGGLVDEPQEGYVPIYQDGGDLLGYLPEHGFGSWLGDNAGKILKGVGGVVSVIPGFGQIAGPILIGAGYATDAIVGHVRKKRAETELEEAQTREEAAAQKRATTSALAAQFDPTKNIDYGATFETYAMGGGLMLQGGQTQQAPEQAQKFPSESQTPVIVDYANGQTHEGPQGGIPVDAKGNPSTTSKQSAVGLTERGEVTWNGYVFSDKLTT